MGAGNAQPGGVPGASLQHRREAPNPAPAAVPGTPAAQAKPAGGGSRRGSLLQALCALLAGALLGAAAAGLRGAARTGLQRKWDGSTGTLVIYVFSNTDPEYLENLRVFVQLGVAEGDGCDYLIVVQEGDQPLPPLPDLPPNARYLRHPNSCYDWGTIGWVLGAGGAASSAEGQQDGTEAAGAPVPSKYKYFIFLNSSVRGPFVPPYLRGAQRWQDVLIDRLSASVKLVGPTISCEGSPYKGNATGQWRTNPHVQSYVLATDQVGLGLLLADGNVFKCWESMWDVIWHGELGSSLAILNAGYNLESLMLRYQGIDWRDRANWGCNGGRNPIGEHFYDGIGLNPLEVLFVKVKESAVQNKWGFSLQAAKYGEWLRQQGPARPEILLNAYAEDKARYRLPRKAYLKARGPSCFDFHYYLQQNPGLKVHKGQEALWAHFLRAGAHEGRAFRFTCEMEA